MQVLGDFDTSVKRALGEIDHNWPDYNGLVICGTHSPKEIEPSLELIREAREKQTPFLGICFGLQLMLIEYARNVLGIADATSEEFGEGTPIIKKMPELRTGNFPVNGQMEVHWHNYQANSLYLPKFREDWGMTFTDGILEMAWIVKHPHFFGTQFHPEYNSTKDKPHHILKDFLEVCYG